MTLSETRNGPPGHPAPSARLDAREFSAAWGMLKLGPMLRSLAPGELLEFLGSDPKLVQDLPRVLRHHGGRVERVEQDAGHYRFLIKRVSVEGPDRPPAAGRDDNSNQGG